MRINAALLHVLGRALRVLVLNRYRIPGINGPNLQKSYAQSRRPGQRTGLGRILRFLCSLGAKEDHKRERRKRRLASIYRRLGGSGPKSAKPVSLKNSVVLTVPVRFNDFPWHFLAGMV